MFDHLLRKKATMVPADAALKGRSDYAYTLAREHVVLHTDMTAPPEEGHQEILVAMGCFWGAERVFWKLPGVITTAVGYAGGYTPYPTYEETCTGQTGHTEVVRVVYDLSAISTEAILKVFWESHDPTQVMRQGNDVGTQYRSAIYTTDERQREVVSSSRERYQRAFEEMGRSGPIATEIAHDKTLYYAEPYHQQYLHKNPNGYCGIRGTGVSCPLPA